MSLYSHIQQEKAGRSRKREEKEEDKKGKGVKEEFNNRHSNKVSQ